MAAVYRALVARARKRGDAYAAQAVADRLMGRPAATVAISGAIAHGGVVALTWEPDGENALGVPREARRALGTPIGAVGPSVDPLAPIAREIEPVAPPSETRGAE